LRDFHLHPSLFVFASKEKNKHEKYKYVGAAATRERVKMRFELLCFSDLLHRFQRIPKMASTEHGSGPSHFSSGRYFLVKAFFTARDRPPFPHSV